MTDLLQTNFTSTGQKKKSISEEQSSKSLSPQITPPSQSQHSKKAGTRQKSPPAASNLVLHGRFRSVWIKKRKQNSTGTNKNRIAKQEPHLSLSDEAEYLMELRWW